MSEGLHFVGGHKASRDKPAEIKETLTPDACSLTCRKLRTLMEAGVCIAFHVCLRHSSQPDKLLCVSLEVLLTDEIASKHKQNSPYAQIIP